jgi:hypothetical protein
MSFPLLLVSAWNDSGGGFLHRLFDGHPECFVYPFELQLGTGSMHDGFEGWFHEKYRWPLLPADVDALPAERLFDLFLDDEVKGYVLSRDTSKFGRFDLDLGLEEWRGRFARLLAGGPRHPEAVVSAYVRALFAAWKNRRASGRERLYLGHCPIVVVDADRILHECPRARLVHVARSPRAGFVDMRRRRPEVELVAYCRKWTLVNALGFYYSLKYPDRVTTVRLDQLIDDRPATLRRLCAWIGLAYDPVLEVPTWNGEPLLQMYPFGGVPVVSAAHERECAHRLSADERAVVEAETGNVARWYGLA